MKYDQNRSFQKGVAIRNRSERFHIGGRIYHPDHKAVEVVTGVEVNLENEKSTDYCF